MGHGTFPGNHLSPDFASNLSGCCAINHLTVYVTSMLQPAVLWRFRHLLIVCRLRWMALKLRRTEIVQNRTDHNSVPVHARKSSSPIKKRCLGAESRMYSNKSCLEASVNFRCRVSK